MLQLHCSHDIIIYKYQVSAMFDMKPIFSIIDNLFQASTVLTYVLYMENCVCFLYIWRKYQWTTKTAKFAGILN